MQDPRHAGGLMKSQGEMKAKGELQVAILWNLENLTTLDWGVLRDIESISGKDFNAEVFQKVWTYLCQLPGDENPGFCIRLFRALLQYKGRIYLEEFVFRNWGNLTTVGRENISYTAALADDSMSNTLAFRLLSHKASSTSDKHLILAGLIGRDLDKGTARALREQLRLIPNYVNNPNAQYALDMVKRNGEEAISAILEGQST